jgi:glycosidase
MEQSRLPMLWGEAQDSELKEFFRWLVHFRRQHPVLWQGVRKTIHLDETAGTYAYLRKDEQENIIVAINLSDARKRFEAAGYSFELAPWSGEVKVLNSLEVD